MDDDDDPVADAVNNMNNVGGTDTVIVEGRLDIRFCAKPPSLPRPFA